MIIHLPDDDMPPNEELKKEIELKLPNARFLGDGGKNIPGLISENVHLRGLFDNMLNGVALCKMIFDNGKPVDYIHLDVNNSYYRLTGLKDVIGKKASELLPDLAKTDTELLNLYGRVASTGVPAKFERYVKSMKMWFSVSTFSPEKEYFVSIFDITNEKKTIEESLLSTEARYRSLYNSMMDGIVGTDMEGRILEFNEVFRSMLGYEKDELLQMTYKDITPAVWSDFEDDIVTNQILTRGYSDVYEKEYRKKDGTKFPVELRTSLIRDQTGQPEMMWAIVRDMTIRKKNEKIIKESENRFRSTIERMLEGCQIIGFDWNYIYINPAAEIHNRRPKEELIGKNYIESWPGIEHSAVYSLIKESMEKRIHLEMENVFTYPDGDTGLFQIHVFPVPEGVFIQSLDISENRKLQEQIIQAQKNQSIGTLASGIAHDFNNILEIIYGYTSLIEKNPCNMEKINEYTSNIARTIARGSELVKQILTFARQTDSIFSPVNLNSILQDLISMLRQTFPRIINISYHAPPDLKPINGDRSQLHQIMLNLSINARDAMPNGGSLSFTLDMIDGRELINRFPAAEPVQYNCLTVTDTGTGMNEDTKNHIFDPFFSTKEKGKGTGLGLAVVYGVIKSHRGFVDVVSVPEKGTSFRIYFPSTEDSVEKQSTLPSIKPLSIKDFSGATILYIEDEEDLIDIMTDYFEAAGFHIIVAKNGAEGVRLYRKNIDDIDLVLSDMGLPEMTGDEVFSEILRINPRAAVILASGYFEPGAKQKLAGVRAFLDKPYNPGHALDTIRKVLSE